VQVWDLLMQLPTNDKILQNLRGLSDCWRDSISVPQCMFRLLYSFQIVESLLEDTKARPQVGDLDMEQPWRVRFIEHGGLKQLLHALMSDQFVTPQGDQDFTCLSKLLKIMFSLIMRPAAAESGDGSGSLATTLQAAFENAAELQAFVHRLLWIFHHAGVTGSASPEGVITAHDIVARHSMSLLEACALRSPQVLSCIYGFDNLKEWLVDCLITCKRPSIRREAARGLIQLSFPAKVETGYHTQFSLVQVEGAVLHPLCYFLDCCLNLSAALQAPCETCADLFSVITNLLSKAKKLCALFAQVSSCLRTPVPLFMYLVHLFAMLALPTAGISLCNAHNSAYTSTVRTMEA
jgi:hypothetical protein